MKYLKYIFLLLLIASCVSCVAKGNKTIVCEQKTVCQTTFETRCFKEFHHCNIERETEIQFEANCSQPHFEALWLYKNDCKIYEETLK